jgi:DNA polymerase
MDQVKKQWTQQETYGGKITENITQAIARDCLAETLLTLERAGHRTVMHIHDEVVVEAPKGTELESLTKLMDQPIPWAPGLILRGDGYETPYYKKD